MSRRSAIGVEFATAVDSLPGATAVRRWARAALEAEGATGEVAIRIMDEAEMADLNLRFRNKRGATNVLSFPAGESPGGVEAPGVGAPGVGAPGVEALGDIAICAPVLQREAGAQGKALEAHFAHLVIHGLLHLLGYDHESEGEAKVMEQKEAAILARFGIDDPYRAEHGGEGYRGHG